MAALEAPGTSVSVWPGDVAWGPLVGAGLRPAPLFRRRSSSLAASVLLTLMLGRAAPGSGGVIRTPDGRPAAGAIVVLAPRNEFLPMVVNGHFCEAQLRVTDETMTTSPAGRHRFERQSNTRTRRVAHADAAPRPRA